VLSLVLRHNIPDLSSFYRTPKDIPGAEAIRLVDNCFLYASSWDLVLIFLLLGAYLNYFCQDGEMEPILQP
jgi:hypothetical protein